MQQVGLITGASSGIGYELAKIHASKGRDLILVARRETRLEEIKLELESRYGIEVMVIAKDLSLESSADEIYQETLKANIQVDYLFNNAGFGGIGTVAERKMQSDIDMIKVNIVALTKLTKLYLPGMLKENKGRILNTSSTASLIPGPNQAVYYASKAYVTSFTNALAYEVNQSDVRVTALLPGPTETEFGRISQMNETSLFNKTYSAYEVALKGYKAMEAGKLEVITGTSKMQALLLKLSPIVPKKLVLSQVKKMQQLPKPKKKIK